MLFVQDPVPAGSSEEEDQEETYEYKELLKNAVDVGGHDIVQVIIWILEIRELSFFLLFLGLVERLREAQRQSGDAVRWMYPRSRLAVFQTEQQVPRAHRQIPTLRKGVCRLVPLCYSFATLNKLDTAFLIRWEVQIV